jgi:hypothetical protein
MNPFLPTEVEVRVSADGSLTPISFSWEGQRLRILDVGRFWHDTAGDHWLVMPAAPLHPFELLRLSSNGMWQVSKPGGSGAVV